MIASLTGTVETCTQSNVVLNVNGIGFDVKMSAEGIREMASRSADEMVHIHTYMSFGREGDVTLFGFLGADELDLFKKLITVSGIGPKGALSLLSVMSAEDLVFAVLAGDSKAISRAPGIGKKTAERLVLELRGKLELTAESFAREDGGENALTDRREQREIGAAGEAVEALTALGYSRAEAAKAVRTAASEEGRKDADTQELLSGALRYL
jgi:holliday junction DNA helicase RuvA